MFDWRDILTRAGWTFVQAFVSAWPVGLIGTDLAAWRVAAVGAALAGLAAVLSFVKTMAVQQLKG